MSEYGNATREAKFRPYNRRQPTMVRSSVLILFAVGVMMLGVAGFYALDRFEDHFRPVVVAQR